MSASVDATNGTANHLNEEELNEMNQNFSESHKPSEESNPSSENEANDTNDHDSKDSSDPSDSNSSDSANTENDSPAEKNLTEKATAHDQPAPQEKTDNTSFLNEKLDKLSSLKESHSFTDFWFYVKEINTLIFTLRGLSKEERGKFKERLSELCEETKKTQDEMKSRISKTSKIKLEQIKSMIAESLSYGTSPADIEKSFQKIDEINHFLKESSVVAEDGTESSEMTREDRDEAREAIHKAKEEILDRKRQIRDNNFKTITEKLNYITDNFLEKKPHQVFNAIKQLRQDMRGMSLDRSQVKEIDNVIDLMWKKAGEKVQSFRSEDNKKKIHDLESSIFRKKDFIKKLNQEIKDLKEKWSDVKNDFFKNRINEWIEEKNKKIENVEKEIESVKEKIQFLTEQMQRQ